jgi:hypothetical protein
VESNNELSETMVGALLEEAGIKGRSRQKQCDVRRFLVENGLLLKQKNYFNDPATGYRHGNFYVCGPGVRFEEEAPQHTHTVSIYYLSPGMASLDLTGDVWPDLLMESRRLCCEQRFRERRRHLEIVFSLAA